jgi:hypothetical protein
LQDQMLGLSAVADEDVGMSGVMGLGDFGNGMGLEAPMNLGNDNDFMLWLENMDWDKQFSCPEFQ